MTTSVVSVGKVLMALILPPSKQEDALDMGRAKGDGHPGVLIKASISLSTLCYPRVNKGSQVRRPDTDCPPHAYRGEISLLHQDVGLGAGDIENPGDILTFEERFQPGVRVRIIRNVVHLVSIVLI